MPTQQSCSTEMHLENVDRTSGYNIKCPKCGEIIPITETIQHQLTERTRREINREMADKQRTLIAKEKELQVQAAKLAEASLDIEAQVAGRLAAEQKALAAKEKDLQAAEARVGEAEEHTSELQS